MKVLVAGATGATGVIGRQLVPELLSAGFEVVAMARTDRRSAQVRNLGVEVVLADALDRERVLTAVGAARPDAVVSLLTSLPAGKTRW